MNRIEKEGWRRGGGDDQSWEWGREEGKRVMEVIADFTWITAVF